MLRNGERIGHLRIERALGVGGMGEVYLARDERLERLVAVKLLPTSRSLDPDARGRMLREARAASALNHPSIVTVHDVGEHDGRAYIVMEHVDGETFDAMIARRGRLAPAEAVALFAQVGDAVAVAHAAGVLHRDLKSANLMIDADGRAKVLDFGLSKRTEAGAPPSIPPSSTAIDSDAPTAAPDSADPAVAETVTPAPVAHAVTQPATPGPYSDDPQTSHGARMGTPGWAPPELMDGLPADARSDVFSLGCVLYHLLAGRPPFSGRTWADVRAQIEAGVPPPSGRPGLDAVVAAALAVDPAKRPESARVLVARARAAITQRRGPMIAIAAAAGVAVAVGAGVLIAGRGGSTTAAAAAPSPDAGPPPPPPPPVQLTRLRGCAYSPTFVDDTTVVFDLTRDGAVDLYKLALAGGDAVQLTSDSGWEWRSIPVEPGSVAFLHQDEDKSALDRIDVTTGARDQVMEGSGAFAYAGGAFYYVPAESVDVRVLRDGRDEVLTTLPAGYEVDSMVASPDGKRLAAIINSDRVSIRMCIIDLERATYTCPNTEVDEGRAGFGRSSGAVYHSARDGITRTVLEGLVSEVIFPKANAGGGLAISPSGATMIFSDCRSRTQLISVVDDPDKPIIVDSNVAGVFLGPDDVLGFVRLQNKGQSIMVRPPGQAVRELVHNTAGRISAPAFSEDGNTVVYVLDKGEPGLHVARLEHSSPNRLTESDHDDTPFFLGDEILFVRWQPDGAPRLMKVAIDGTGEAIANPRPRRIIGVDPKRRRVLLAEPSLKFLYWWDPKTGKEHPAPKTVGEERPTTMDLSADGRWLLTLTGNNGHEAWVQDLAGDGVPVQVYMLRDDRTARAAAIDSRGHPVLAVDSWEGELWRADAAEGAPW